MTQPSTPRPVALATLVLITLTAAACGHSSPVAPDAAAARTDAAATASGVAPTGKPGSDVTASAGATYPLLGGTFTIAGRKGAQISGIYTGETTESNGVSTTTLRLEVQNGIGGLAGATGVLEGKGTGAFTGEGNFSLLVSGSLATSGKKKSRFSASVQGSSTLACADGTIIVSLHADGPAGGKSEAEMRHQVGNAGCGF